VNAEVVTRVLEGVVIFVLKDKVPVTFGRRKSMLRSKLRLVESFRQFARDANGNIARRGGRLAVSVGVV
jgi:hypothetical protein